MNFLTINCGRSSLKMRLCAVDESSVTALCDGAVEAIGPSAVVDLRRADGSAFRISSAIGDHSAALLTLLYLLDNQFRRSIEAVGHRVVQGGSFIQPALFA